MKNKKKSSEDKLMYYLAIISIILLIIFSWLLFNATDNEIQDDLLNKAKFVVDIKTNQAVIRLDLDNTEECTAVMLLQQYFKDTEQVSYQIPITCR